MKLVDKQAIQEWDAYARQVFASTTIDLTETTAQQRTRILKLEADPEAWFIYYFPKFAYAVPAAFHKAATKRVLANKRWYEVRAWSRELAKSTRTMMEVMYMVLTKMRYNVLMISNSADNAERLLKPYKINLENNQRIIHDYGKQESYGDWTGKEFITQKGASFRAIGAGQSPRGTRAEEKRIDVVLVDDFDTDEECKNPRIIQEKWEWLEQAVFPTVSISGNYSFIFCGNIIAKDCCITRAKEKAHHTDIINIRDKNGKSSWPQKNSEQDIDDVLAMISYISQQKEYFNNPLTLGSVFKEMLYKDMPPLSQYPFLVCYIDLSYKAGANNDNKAAIWLGKWKDEYHVLYAYNKAGTTSELAKAMAEIDNQLRGKVAVYYIAEELFLLDMIVKELHEAFTALNSPIVVSPDKRKKGDKFTRIEVALEPLNTRGKFFLNEAERSNVHMKTTEEQFLAIQPGAKTKDDGPDAAEGAKWELDNKINVAKPVTYGARPRNNKRY